MADTKAMTPRTDAEVRHMEEEYRVPAVDIFETEETIVLLADMPGVTDKGVEVSVGEDTLSIIGRLETQQSIDVAPLYAEFEPMPFRRVFTLSDDIRTEGIEGRMQNGVLRLTLPKADEAKVRRIPIKTQ